jgi:hypothetical protein
LGALCLESVSAAAEQAANVAHKTSMTKTKAFSLMKSPPFAFDERVGLLHPIRKFGRKELDVQFYSYPKQPNNAAESQKYYKHGAS